MNKLFKWPFLNDLTAHTKTLWSDMHLEHPDFYHRFINLGTTLPAANIKETEHAYEIDLAVPGFRKEDLKLLVDPHRLTIFHHKSTDQDETIKEYTRQEYSFSSFKRVFSLPEDANSDAIGARYENGILHIHISKKEFEKPSTEKEVQIL